MKASVEERELNPPALPKYRFGRVLLGSLLYGLLFACVEGIDPNGVVPGDNAAPGGGAQAPVTKGSSGGLTFPSRWENYGVIGASDRTDGGDASTIVLLLGDEAAVLSARALASGAQATWNEGSTIVRLVWRDKINPNSADTQASGDFASLTVMKKDSSGFADTGGWGYGLWKGNDLLAADTTQPIVNNETCFACHDREVKDKDYVFTNPVAFPTPQALGAAATSSGISFPQGAVGWKFIGVHKRLGANQIRVITGNDTAVNAARSGQTKPWPDGSQIADFVFAGADNLEWRDAATNTAKMVETGNFAALAYMVKDSNVHSADNGYWGYGFWRGAQLGAEDAANANIVNNETCAACHNREVTANDYVFTLPALLPTAR